MPLSDNKPIPGVDEPAPGYAWVKYLPFSAWINPGDLIAGVFLVVVLSVFTFWNKTTPPGGKREILFSENAANFRVPCASQGCSNFSNGKPEDDGHCNACARKLS